MKTASIIILILLVLVCSKSYSQKDPLYSQYIFNGLVINPAYAGSKEIFNINAFYRQQWQGFSSAPQTQSLSIDGNINKNVNLGFYVLNDSWGAQRNTSVYGVYAYKIKFDNKSKLSFGLAGGISQLSLDGTKLSPDDNFDPVLPLTMEKKTLFNANSGIYYNTEIFYAGFSVFNLLSDIYSIDKIIKQPKNYFLSTGYLIDLSPNIKLKPSLLIKETFTKEPGNIDLNAFVLFQEKIWLGISLRGNVNWLHQSLHNGFLLNADAIAIIMEYYINNNFKIGYAYDISTTVLKKYGSHELALGYYIFKVKEAPMLTPRYF